MLQMVMQLLCATCQRKKICLNIGMMRMILNLKKDQKSHIQVDLESQNGFKTEEEAETKGKEIIKSMVNIIHKFGCTVIAVQKCDVGNGYCLIRATFKYTVT